MKLIYGSTAIKYYFPDFREPQDLDYIVSTDEEYNESSREIQYYCIPEFDTLIELNKDPKYVDPDILYTIKVSHAAWDIRWEKTMKDVDFLRTKGCKLNYSFYKLLYGRWEISYGKKNVKMNVPNSEFFKENIYRKYNHEELHEHFAFYDRPLNEKIRDNINSPLCSKDLWEDLMYSDKLKCALEEIFVICTERYIAIEKPLPTKVARIKTLKQMITSTTSGWFCRYLIENFEELRTMEEKYFVNKLDQLQRANL